MEGDQKDLSLPATSPPLSSSSSVRFNSNRRSFPVAPGEDNYLLLRVCVPDLNIKKCFQFRKDEKISEIKDQCIASLPLELKQSFNYGLFCPPTNTKCGNFLDEDKLLNEYPFSEYAGYLELRFKQRVYKASRIDEKQFKAINSRTNLRRFIDYIRNGQTEKVTKICDKGLDPNFHCVDSGETPLTLACSTSTKPAKIIDALFNGGAFLDFRNLSGSTPLHRAVENNNLEAVITLLELGTYVNAKDSRGLTPLYLSVTCKTNVTICEKLLFNKSTIGAQDMQGWQEIHQACRYGLVEHLELLLSYGADINGQNASGNTPLHVCAVNGQEHCAKLLLRRGALNDSLNYANQSPYQVAVIAGNLELAAIVQAYKNSEIDRKTLGDCSDVVSNNSSGIGTTISDFTDSNFPLKGAAQGCIYSNSTIAAPIYDIAINSRSSSPQQQLQNNRFLCYDQIDNSSTPPGIGDDCYLRLLSKNPTASITNGGGDRYYATAPRQKHKWLPCEPKTVVLHKTKRGFGFILRGAKATSSLMEVRTSAVCPALQYLDDVDKGSVADLAGLRKGDYLLAINDEDVSTASHEKVVDLIKNSGKLVTMTVISRAKPPHETRKCHNERPKASAAIGDDGGGAAVTAAAVAMPAPRFGYATLPNKLKKHVSSSAGHIVAPLPPRRDPKTTLTVGNWDQLRHHHRRHRLLHQQHLHSYRQIHQHRQDNCRSPPAETNFKDSQPKIASIRSRPTSSRITAAELEELFQRQAELSPVYREQQRQNADENAKKSCRVNEKAELRRNFFSVPDLVQISLCNNSYADVDVVANTDIGSTATLLRNHKSQDNVNELEKILSRTDSEQCSAVANTKKTLVVTPFLSPPGMTTAATFGPNCIRDTNAARSAAAIYAVPSADVGHPNRPQVRKSASLHSHSHNSSQYGRVSLGGSYHGNVNPSDQHNQSHQQRRQEQHCCRYESTFSGHVNKITRRLSSSTPSPPLPLLQPVIPDPDYSQSDEENEQTIKKPHKTNILPLSNSFKVSDPVSHLTSPTADNVTTADVASTNSSNDEICLTRSLLANASRFPSKYITSISNGAEDGDNSSSGVSSDQEVVPVISLSCGSQDSNAAGSRTCPSTAGSNNELISPSRSLSPNNKSLLSFANLPAFQLATVASQRTTKVESSQKEFVVLPPPDYIINGVSLSATSPTTIAADVLEPPPQFSDYRTC